MVLENCPNSKCNRPLRPDDQFAYCPDCRFPLRKLEGKYRFEKKLGRGGFGSVYLAQHTGLDKKCAIKLLHSDLLKNESDKDDFTRRFQKEAKLIVQLSSHPHVVDVYDIGVDSMLGHYYVMEHLDGCSLKDLLAGKPLEPALVAPVMRQICEAVGAAHAMKIVHRDLKPQNIMLLPQTAGYWVKLIDFGIAKVIAETADIDKMTRGIGSAEYMAPEQVKGKGVSPKTDIYALGTIAYELLTGATPFGHVGSHQGILFAQFSETPEPLSEKSLALPASTVAGLDRELQRALSKAPQQRHQSVEEFWKALEIHLQGVGESVPSGMLPTLALPAPAPAQRPPAPDALELFESSPSSSLAAGQMESRPSGPPPVDNTPKVMMLLALLLLAMGASVGVWVAKQSRHKAAVVSGRQAYDQAEGAYVKEEYQKAQKLLSPLLSKASALGARARLLEKKVRSEQANHKRLQSSQKLRTAGKLLEARQVLKGIPKGSRYSDRAVAEDKELLSLLIGELKLKAIKAWNHKRSRDAQKHAREILKYRPNHGWAKMLLNYTKRRKRRRREAKKSAQPAAAPAGGDRK